VAGSQALFVRLAEVMGRPDLLAHPDFAALEVRVKHAVAVERIAAAWAAGHTADELVELLSRAGVPAASGHHRRGGGQPAAPPPRPHHPVEHPSAGSVPVVGPVIGFSESPAAIRRPAPRLGEHTEEVLREWLSLSPERVTALRADGVV
jgi:crotonobetainyl-CoA:carnitine CoA-transferase CaiB-like acyl-CoA transferase